jgi:PAS domain S-box-containing protein
MYCIFGLEPEQFRANYEAFINCVHPDDRELVEKSVSSALYENKPHDIEYRVTLPDESERVVRALGKVTFDDTGQPVRMVGTVQDITERKHAEELFKNLAGSSTVGIYIVQDGKFRYVNPQFQRYSGFSEDELLGKDSLDLVFPEDRELVRGNAIRMLKGEITTGYEYRSVNRDGSIQWTLETVAPIQYQGRRATIGNYMDITERKQAEARVRQAAEEWRTTFDSITDAVSIHDKNYRILRVNRAFADMFHMKPQQIIGQHCYEIMHGTDCPWDNCPHQQTLATRKPATIELYEPKVGLYLQASTSPILNERSEVVATVHIARDITERKHQEEQLIMTDRLASVGELVAGIAHELNNPLTSVIGFSALLREAKVPAGVKEDLDIITHEAQRAAGIVKNLLTFARKHETVKQPSQINNIIEEVLKLRAYEQKVSNIAVRRHLARTLPEIPVDYFQMQQVLLNIIVNAETAMLDAHHKGTLTITTRKVNGTVRIILTDDGPGIPKENLDRIFNPFFTTKEVGKGTGLGLSICHGIITAHGGNIYARSKPGSGATFVVELPISGN